jgi:hypothetical protein
MHHSCTLSFKLVIDFVALINKISSDQIEEANIPFTLLEMPAHRMVGSGALLAISGVFKWEL